MEFSDLFSASEQRLVRSCMELGLTRDVALRTCIDCHWDSRTALRAAMRVSEEVADGGAAEEAARSGDAAVSAPTASPAPRVDPAGQEPVREPEPAAAADTPLQGWLLYKAPASWRARLGLHLGSWARMAQTMPEVPTDRLISELKLLLVRVTTLEEALNLWATRHHAAMPLHRH